MSIRVFATVDRGMVDKPLVNVFAWEVPILEEIFGDVQVHTVEELTSVKGAALVNKLKLRHTAVHAPDLETQIRRMMNTVPDEVNPLESPESEYHRLSTIYGAHPELPALSIEVVYGRFNEGRFTDAIKKAFAGQKAIGPSDDPELVKDVKNNEPAKPLDSKAIKAKLDEWGVTYGPREAIAILAEKVQYITALKADDMMDFDVNAPLEELKTLYEAIQ